MCNVLKIKENTLQNLLQSGWLYQLGYKDFAGSSVVHASSGVCALVASYLIGPRKGLEL